MQRAVGKKQILPCTALPWRERMKTTLIKAYSRHDFLRLSSTRLPLAEILPVPLLRERIPKADRHVRFCWYVEGGERGVAVRESEFPVRRYPGFAEERERLVQANAYPAAGSDFAKPHVKVVRWRTEFLVIGDVELIATQSR